VTVDMYCHWNYVMENLLGPVRAVTAKAVTHIPVRWDEQGREYHATADDAVYGIFEMDGGIVAQINSSWAVRVYRDELVEFQIDGTHGSAVAGLRRCVAQQRAHTPRPVWNPDLPDPIEYQALWSDVPDNTTFDNGFKVQWEQFLRAAAEGRPVPWDLAEGARGVQLAGLARQSSAEGRRVDVRPLAV